MTLSYSNFISAVNTTIDSRVHCLTTGREFIIKCLMVILR